jgi:OOP family OmpA-OmpF porin
MKIRWNAVLALALTGSAWADDGHAGRPHTHWWLELNLNPSWYAGGALGQSTFEDWFFDDGSLSRNADDSDTAMRVFGGVSFGRYLALELGYTDFGEASFRGQSDGSGGLWNAGPVAEKIGLEGYDVALLGKLPVADDWALFGKVGYLTWESTLDLTGDTQCCGPVSDHLSGDDASVSYAGGVQYDGFGPLRVVAEYGAVEFDYGFGEAEVASFGLSLVYLFEGSSE